MIDFDPPVISSDRQDVRCVRCRRDGVDQYPCMTRTEFTRQHHSSRDDYVEEIEKGCDDLLKARFSQDGVVSGHGDDEQR